ncbi:MAG: DUF4221 family protein [Bacteroides sp.]|nr:DUF4221 family protein [Bacteroides sp.]
MKQINLLFSLFILLLSCSTDSKREGTKEYSLLQVADKMFYLDSLTTQESLYMQVVDDKELALYNEPDHSIRFYDIPTAKEFAKIQLYKEGPNATKDMRGFYYQSKNDIWIYQYFTKELLLVNDLGEIKARRDISKKLYPHAKKDITVSPFPITNMPIQKYNDWLILQGMNGIGVENGIKPACTILYNTVTDEVKTVNYYPSIYGDMKNINNNWGTFSYRAVPYTLTPQNEMILSYPADDSIRIYNIDKDYTESYFAGYTIKTKIKPIIGNSTIALEKQYLEQLQYAGIHYDKYNKVYYRLAVLPISDYNINDVKTQNKPLAIIILNHEFKKVGEYHLGKGKYRHRNTFVSEEGLHINVLSEDDDYLKFVTLKIIKNEN